MDWAECPPAQAGVREEKLARALELVRLRGACAQLCVLREGRVVLDRAYGCRPDALFWIFSASKPFIAMLVHRLAERGDIDLDAPVCRYWPEFARNGKAEVTVRQVLRHRSGMASARGVFGDLRAIADWDRSIANIERAQPRWPPGQVPAYQSVIFGFILGELVRRVGGVSPGEKLRADILHPLGLDDVHLGLPDELWSRHVDIRGHGPGARLSQRVINRRPFRRAVIPSAGISTTARGLAQFYQALLAGGELNGTRVLSEATILEARRPSSNGEMDRVLKLPIRWAQGFQLGGDPARRPPMGRLSSAETFGHNGSNCCLAWADPRRDLVFVYLTNLLIRGHEGARYLCAISDAVISACG